MAEVVCPACGEDDDLRGERRDDLRTREDG